MPENAKERRSQSHRDERLPYDQQNWNRRLAEARARRAATLREREAQQAYPASPSERLAAAWDGDRDALAVVTGPIAAAPAEPPVASANAESKTAATDAKPDPVTRARRQPASLRPAVALLAGCVIGASLTGFLLLASGAERTPKAVLASAGGASAATSDAPPQEPVEVAALQRSRAAQPPVASPVLKANGDGAASPAPAESAVDAAKVAPPPTDELAFPARTDLTLPSDGRPPADDATATGAGEAPAPASAQQLAVPDLINAPQVLSPTGILPEAPASIERVVVLAPRSVSQAGREEAASLLREAGWPARDPATSPFTISSTHVRYYHEEDRPGAEALAALFSADARDFTSYSPRPEEGMIELWLAGRAPARHPQPQAPSLARFLGRLAVALELRN